MRELKLRVSEMRVLVRERRVILLRVQENGRGLLFPKDYRDRVEAIRAKVRVGAIRAKARVGARARQGRCFVSSASSLDM